MILDDLENIEFSDNSRLNFDHDLSRLNWFNIGGKTKVFFFANSLKDLSLFLKKYNNRGKIFILGHVMTEIDHQELLYFLNSLSFIKSIENNVIIDELVWENTNALLVKNSSWRAINLTSIIYAHPLKN